MQATQHDVFQAIADPTRRQLLALLADDERTVQALCAPFEMTRPAISKHLQVLADAGLVHTRRAGRETFYALDPTPLRDLRDWLSAYERFWDDRLRRLRQHVEQPVAAPRKPARQLEFGED